MSGYYDSDAEGQKAWDGMPARWEDDCREWDDRDCPPIKEEEEE